MNRGLGAGRPALSKPLGPMLLTGKQPAVSSLTEGRIWSNIWTISWPMLLIMLFNFFVGFTDVYVAGRISPDVQAAVGFISQLYFLLIVLANAVSVGAVALVSRSMGAGDIHGARHQARQSLLFGLAIATILTAAGLLLHRHIVALAGFPDEIREIGDTFLRIFALALGPNYLLIISNAVFRAGGEVRKPLFTMFLVSVLNAVLDFALVFGWFPFPPLGYPGIAMATAGSTCVGMVVSLALFRGARWKKFFTLPWTFSPVAIRRIAAVAWPAAALQLAWNAGSIVLYNILGRLGEAGVSAMAAITNGYRIEAVIFLPAFALHMSASVLVGQNLGARKPGRASRAGWEVAFMGMIILSLISLVIFIYARPLAQILSQDAAVVSETVRYLRINLISEPFMALSIVLGGGLQGAGDSRGAMWIIVTAMWMIRLPLAFVLALGLGYGATGVWIAMLISMTVQGLLMARRFHAGAWKEIRIS